MNPLHVEIVQTLVPVANEVFHEIRLEVRGEEVVDPKIEPPINNRQSEFMRKLTKVCDVAYIMFLLLFLLAFLGGFIMLLVWMSSPNIFGGQQF